MNLRKLGVIAGTTALTLGSALPAFAVENAAVTTAMTGVKTDVIDTLSAVAPVAVAIFGVFLVWKLGKKIFSMVGK